MNKFILKVAVVALILMVGCSKKDDPSPDPKPTPNPIDFSKVEIQDFIWKGLNTYYYWKENVPNLANTKDDNKQEYFNLLNSKSDPSDFFYSLCYKHKNNVSYDLAEDKWSWIVDDYVALENSFAGVYKTNGLSLRISRIKSGSDDLFGWIQYVMPNSDASDKDVKRGDTFTVVDGEKLTVKNYERLLFNKDTYTLHFSDIVNGSFVSNGRKTMFTKQEGYTENPIFIAKTLDVEGKKIGYLMYNSFTANFDQEMNAAFGKLKTEGVTDLVLDLRYNGGGSINSSVYLASLITGQFKGQVFAKEKWNPEIQAYFEKNAPSRLVNNFTDRIIKKDKQGKTILDEELNSLNLNKLTIIVSGNSASASELVINGLDDAYIDVTLVGTKTHGKYTGSVTLYDYIDDKYTRNPKHKYAMQPIVLETVNKNGRSIKGGIEPDYKEIEYINEMKALGSKEEPLLAKAIELITGVSAKGTATRSTNFINYEKITTSKEMENKFNFDMYTDKRLQLGLSLK